MRNIRQVHRIPLSPLVSKPPQKALISPLTGGFRKVNVLKYTTLYLQMARRWHGWTSLVVIGFGVLFYIFASIQTPQRIVGWESITYLNNAESFRAGDIPNGPMPAVGRVGVSLLVAALPFGAKSGFWVVNLIANCLGCVLLFRWLSRRLSNGLSLTLTLLYSCHWLAPMRMFYWGAITPDSWAFVALVLGLLAIDKKPSVKQYWFLIAISFFGVIIRESVIVIPLAYATKRFAERGPDWIKQSVVPLAAAALGLLTCRFLVHITDQSNLLRTMYHWSFEKTWPQALLGFFMSFGVASLFAFNQRTKDHARKHPEHVVFMVVMVVAAWLGGTDTERIFLWSAPIALLWIGYGLQNNDVLTNTLVAVCTVFTLRLLWQTPQFPGGSPESIRFLTPLTSSIMYTELLSFHMLRGSSAVILGQYILAGCVALGLTRLSKLKSRSD